MNEKKRNGYDDSICEENCTYKYTDNQLIFNEQTCQYVLSTYGCYN